MYIFSTFLLELFNRVNFSFFSFHHYQIYLIKYLIEIMHDSHLNLLVLNRLHSRTYALSLHTLLIFLRINSQMKNIIYFTSYIYVIIMIFNQLAACLYI